MFRGLDKIFEIAQVLVQLFGMNGRWAFPCLENRETWGTRRERQRFWT